MRGGRKNLKRAVEEEMVTLQQGQSIMQVVDLRGSNLTEVHLLFLSDRLSYFQIRGCAKTYNLNVKVMDAKGQKLLAIFPAKFQKSMWIKRGFVLLMKVLKLMLPLSNQGSHKCFF